MPDNRKLSFVKLDVFTSQNFSGNPLAIVLIPPNLSLPLSREKKQHIAREFNLSETVFVHEHAEGGDEDFLTEIFTPYAEIPFAGHPTIGAGYYLLSRCLRQETITLRTKAGHIPVTRGGDGGVRLQVPVDFKAHGPHPHPYFKREQAHLRLEDFVNGIDGPEEIVSIVKGMTFQLLELASVDALGRLEATTDRIAVPEIVDEAWARPGRPFLGIYAFCILDAAVDVVRVRARRFYGSVEDPATGSAASALAGYLAQKSGTGVWNFEVEQGVEMGRRSKIGLEVTVDAAMSVTKIELSGEAVRVMNGSVQM